MSDQMIEEMARAFLEEARALAEHANGIPSAPVYETLDADERGQLKQCMTAAYSILKPRIEQLEEALREIRSFAAARTNEGAGFGLIVRAADHALNPQQDGGSKMARDDLFASGSAIISECGLFPVWGSRECPGLQARQTSEQSRELPETLFDKLECAINLADACGYKVILEVMREIRDYLSRPTPDLSNVEELVERLRQEPAAYYREAYRALLRGEASPEQQRAAAAGIALHFSNERRAADTITVLLDGRK
jgi:hypothetical protein